MNCKLHGIEYKNGLDDNYQSTNQYFCTECIKESENNNLLLERTFIVFLSKSYFITVIFPFVYSILSILLEAFEYFGCNFKEVFLIKLVASLSLSILLTWFLIQSRKKSLKPVISITKG